MLLTKYANRRLYNPETSMYVNLSEVWDFVRHGATLEIMHRDTKVDVTREVLLEVLKQRELEAPRLSTAELHELIRAE